MGCSSFLKTKSISVLQSSDLTKPIQQPGNAALSPAAKLARWATAIGAKHCHNFTLRNYMPSLVDPSVVLPSFQEALDTGTIKINPCTFDKTLFHHLDIANGEARMTYVRLNNERKVTVLIQFLQAQPYKGERCIDVAWAVPQEFRGKGRAGEAFLAAVREMRHSFLSTQREKAFYVEGIVGLDNMASRKTAEKVFASIGTLGTDSNSGERIVQYFRRIEATTDLRLP